MTEHAYTIPDSLSSLEDMIPEALLEPVLRRPIPFVAAAFGLGVATGLLLRARGDLVPRESRRDRLGRFGAAPAAAGRRTAAVLDDLGFGDVRDEIAGRVRTLVLDAITGYLDRAVDRAADAAHRTVSR